MLWLITTKQTFAWWQASEEFPCFHTSVMIKTCMYFSVVVNMMAASKSIAVYFTGKLVNIFERIFSPYSNLVDITVVTICHSVSARRV